MSTLTLTHTRKILRGIGINLRVERENNGANEYWLRGTVKGGAEFFGGNTLQDALIEGHKLAGEPFEIPAELRVTASGATAMSVGELRQRLTAFDDATAVVFVVGGVWADIAGVRLDRDGLVHLDGTEQEA